MKKLNRFKFGLRTMLIVFTILTISLAVVYQQLRWISERNRAITWMRNSSWYWREIPENYDPFLNKKAPWRIRLLSADGLESVCLLEGNEKEAIERLFPEAEVFVSSLHVNSDNRGSLEPWNSAEYMENSYLGFNFSNHRTFD